MRREDLLKISQGTDGNQQNTSERGRNGNRDNLLEMCMVRDGGDKRLKVSRNGDDRDGERRHLKVKEELGVKC